MRRERGVRRDGLLAALCVLGLLLAGGCGRAAPDQRLREQLSSMQEALEERSPRDFMEGVAADFDGNGGLDRAALQQVVRAQVLANARVGVTLGPAEVEVQGDRATVRFTAMTTGGDRFVPDRVQAWDVTSGWRDEEGAWRLYYAEWKPK